MAKLCDTFAYCPLTSNLGLSATLREQPSTLAFRPRYANNLQHSTFNIQHSTLNLKPSINPYN
ncbi:MAG: hypothetical protein F6K50_14730 [Moorea sp. SIO3I7]|uniref:hypothetical protein n=1 Tax=Moorena sp. SIO3I8 TaxID=2607833 RepID=UPI0013C046A7|nr:hypothetical protein [Moorena sp. SIO3I8]NEN96737.1 hypothetical protein [Moorena sp. SIO3I7]NEO07010.1 hypothetical protein [Moorena sp. SIO3I8]